MKILREKMRKLVERNIFPTIISGAKFDSAPVTRICLNLVHSRKNIEADEGFFFRGVVI